MQTRRSMKNHLIEGDPINSGVIARVPFQQLGIARGAHAMKSGI
jgi:hypothetical protein